MDRQWINREADAPARRRQMRQVTQPLLAVAGLSKTFPRLTALIDVDFAVCSGEIVALVGQNGSGKSTLVKVLTGIHEGDPGARVTLGGQADGAASGLMFDVTAPVGALTPAERTVVASVATRAGWRCPFAATPAGRSWSSTSTCGRERWWACPASSGRGASTSRPCCPVRCLAAMVTWPWPGSRFPQVTRAPRSARGSPTSLAIAAPMAR